MLGLVVPLVMDLVPGSWLFLLRFHPLLLLLLEYSSMVALGTIGECARDFVEVPLQVGACLQWHWQEWENIKDSEWVVKTLRYSYILPFLRDPPLLSSPVDAGKGSCRTGGRPSGQFLFWRLPCAQGHWGLEADLLSFGLKSFPGGGPLPHGDGFVRARVNGRGGVDGAFGSARHILSGSCPPSVTQVHVVRPARQSLPVLDSVLQPCHGS